VDDQTFDCSIVRLALAAMLVLAVACHSEEPRLAATGGVQARPNIILLIGDDHGWNHSGFMGNEIVHTPTLDRLASEGTVFSTGMSTASVCYPALRSLLTGLHPREWTAQELRLGKFLGRDATIADMVTLPRQLAQQGYVSFEAGKWWEGIPQAAGFTDGTGTARSSISELGTDGLARDRDGLRPVLSFLDDHESEPFFLWLAPKLPHLPFDAGKRFRKRYRRKGLSPTAIDYYANTTRMDAFFGRLISELEARGLTENTLIIYLADNGWQQDPFVEHFGGGVLGGPKGKLSPYELGFRTPFVFWLPGRIPSGVVIDDLVSFYDLHATMLDYAGIGIPPSHRGFSLRPHIEGRGVRKRSEFYSSMFGVRVREEEYERRNLSSWITAEYAEFLRTDEWRYVHHRDRDQHELFHIASDPFEEHDVAEQYPDILAEMQSRTRQHAAKEGHEFAEVLDLFGELNPPSAHAVLKNEQVEFILKPGADGRFVIHGLPATEYELTTTAGGVALPGGDLRASMTVDFAGFLDSPYLRLEARRH
jgi:uncharacterized sulfatase